MVQAVIFLGNPGSRYRQTRHNAGRLLYEALPELAGEPSKKRFKGLYSTTPPGRRTIHLLRPETYMNKSGESAAALAGFFKIPPGEILAVHDDLELPFGRTARKTGGGLGGHNGLRSLRQHLRTPDFQRLRIGIGRPPRGDVSSWVLGRWTPAEAAELPQVLAQAGNLLRDILQET